MMIPQRRGCTPASWVLGFLSGIGYVGIDDPLNEMDSEGVLAGQITTAVSEHPIDEIANAAAAFSKMHRR